MARKQTWTVKELARASGLGRTYVYYLVKRGILKPSGPKGTRVRFDENALQMAKVFARLQLRHGLQPRGLVDLIGEALLAYSRRVVTEKLRPRQEKMDQIKGEIVDLLLSSDPKAKLDEILDKALRVKSLRREVEAHNYDLFKIPEDDPAWEALNPFFKTRGERAEFLRLLWRAGVLPEIVRGIEAPSRTRESRQEVK